MPFQGMDETSARGFVTRVAHRITKAALRNTRWAYTALAIALLLAGLVLRAALVYPEYSFSGDSDAVLAGISALEVLDGKRPVFFPGGYRLGPHTCYLAAALFSVIGVSRIALATTALLFGCIANLLVFLTLRAVWRTVPSLVALMLFVLPPAQVLLNTAIPWGYGEIMMYCAGAVWLATLAWRRAKPLPWYLPLSLGLCCGLALWSSIQTLMVLIPVAIFLVARRVFRVRDMGFAAAGVLTGGAPLWIFLASGGWSTYRSSFSVGPAGSVAASSSNLLYALREMLPALLTGSAQNMSLWAFVQLGTYALILGCAAGLLVSCGGSTVNGVRWFGALAIAIAANSVALFAVSGAGNFRPGVVRYLLPFYLAVPFAYATAASWLRRGRPVLAAAVAVTVFVNVPQYPVFANAHRRALERARETDRRLVQWLEHNHIGVVVGDYWLTYKLNFDSNRAVSGVPLLPGHDYFNIEQKLSGPARWAVLDNRLDHLKEWQSRLRVDGRIVSFGPDLFLLDLALNPPTSDAFVFLADVRTAAPER